MDIDLPPHLERRCPVDRPAPRAGAGVVVWLRVAVRGHENPALDTGRLVAAALGVPLLVYHAVSERYPHASDRHHTFILQGATDLARELAALGVSAAFHVERPGHDGPVLRDLAARACLVVTDAMPLDPLRRWTRNLASVAPVWEVDSSCIVPLPAMNRRITRAYLFRDRSKPLRESLDFPWVPVDVRDLPWTAPLGFEPVDPRTADLAALVGSCRIDHSVAPVPDTPGGSRAGYARWDAFRDGPLARYARRRNDAARADGVSRMSAYLHYGHVSPFRIAREAAAAGAEKYLDELLVWRELAWHFCNHTPDPRAFTVLPEWARATLTAHASDPREVLPLEALEEGRTGETLWDLAQHSLVRHGELHNNVRMTWGKAILKWSKGPRQTLSRLFELNDRYALDGRDPSSVGGLVWCLGGMDRPFDPEQPVFGRVRARSVSTHARRLDLERYRERVHRARTADDPRVLVVGAGIAGAAAAATLARVGVDVTVVDKARGPAGRMSSRRSEHGRFDHGAPSFTVADPRFERQVKVWESAGRVVRWSGTARVREGDDARDVPFERWVGVPRMSALPRHVLHDVPLQTSTRITSLTPSTEGWEAHTESGRLGVFDRVILTAPAPQSRALAESAGSPLAATLAQIAMEPRWTALIVGSAAAEVPVVKTDGVIGLAHRQDLLPGREGPERWVVHASLDWSVAHLEDSRESVASALTEAWQALGGAVDTITVHRWRYARVANALERDWVGQDGLIFAGDGARGRRVEDAWLSGVAAAGAILRGEG